LLPEGFDSRGTRFDPRRRGRRRHRLQGRRAGRRGFESQQENSPTRNVV